MSDVLSGALKSNARAVIQLWMGTTAPGRAHLPFLYNHKRCFTKKQNVWSVFLEVDPGLNSSKHSFLLGIKRPTIPCVPTDWGCFVDRILQISTSWCQAVEERSDSPQVVTLVSFMPPSFHTHAQTFAQWTASTMACVCSYRPLPG